MYLENLTVTNFRNLEALSTTLSAGVNVFHGDNGSGKTNLLEAIFVLCLGRSHRAALEAVMIREGSDFYRVFGTVCRDEQRCELAVAFQKGARKKITIDKVPIRIAELYDNFCAVAAGPEDAEILCGAPSTRRNFVDIYLSQYSRKYLNTLSQYQKATVQKNAALKRQMDPAPFNELMAEYGCSIMAERLSFLNQVGESAEQYYHSISQGGVLALTYRPSVRLAGGEQSADEIKVAFRRALKQSAEKERVMETSMVGPHRDDVEFTINGLPARTHGSQGEWRTAAIALKLAVYHLLRERRSARPILLLDEIFAELDNKRCENLILAFKDFQQLFLTTAGELPQFLSGISTNYRIAGGTLKEVS